MTLNEIIDQVPDLIAGAGVYVFVLEVVVGYLGVMF